MRIGAQVSSARAFAAAIPHAREIGAECVQVHIGAPQRWSPPPYSAAQVADFRHAAADAGIGPNVAHALYLVNLASPNPELRGRAIESLGKPPYWSRAP